MEPTLPLIRDPLYLDEIMTVLSPLLASGQSRAACRDRPDEMFVDGAAQKDVKRVCAPCPLRTACLAEALDNRIEFGVWGGMTERERRVLLRHHPGVRDWAAVLRYGEQAHHEHRERARAARAA